MASLDLSSLGWDPTFAASYALCASASGSAHASAEPARVCRVHRGGVDTLTAAGACRATLDGDLLAATARDPVAAPVTGDWVVVRHWPDRAATVTEVLERRTAVARAAAASTSHAQVLAANVEVVMIVVSLAVEPHLGRMERLLALAWDSGAQPVVVLTKADLVEDAALVRADVVAAAPGVAVRCVSAVTGDGLDGLADHLGPGRTAALLGTSGAGKSTLVNALAGASLAATREVRRDGKGKHTTTVRELVLLPQGGLLVDTPGLRGAGLLESGEGVERVFGDIEALAAQCRFADCGHAGEPGCAVVAAVEEGRLPERRLASWRKLGREAAYMAARTDARLRAERRRQWKAIHLSVRRSGVARP